MTARIIVENIIEESLRRLAVRPRGAWKVRPSGIHRCGRAQVLASRLDPEETFELNPKTALAFAVGTAIHEIIQGQLPEVPAEEAWDSGTMTGHSDLRIIRDGASYVLADIKTINVEGYIEVAKKGPKPEHVAQANWYAVQAGCPYGAIVYVNKNGTIPAGMKADKDLNPTFQVLPFDVDPALAAEMDEKAQFILDHVKAGTLPRYEQVIECRWCDHKAACQAALVTEAKASAHEWRHINSKVVGTTFRAGGFNWSEVLTAGSALVLEWDKDNPHGPRRADGTAAAVKVIAEGHHIGFLPATGSPTAEIVSDHLAAGGTVSCRVTEITGGGPGKNHGLNIEIELHGSDL